jgi:hypothetical protein
MTEFTIEELKERLKGFDEMTLLEELEIDSAMIIEAFEDLIIERQNKLRGMIDEQYYYALE